MTTLKIKLTIAYDGREYQGWQAQRIGTGIQEKVEAALRKLCPSIGRIHGSSRTDTGVHALGMVAHVEVPRAEFRMALRRLPLAINAHLPDDIRVVSAQRAAAKFHSRFDASGKEYRYLVWNHPVMNPLLRHQAWHVPIKVDLGRMRTAARLLVGRHDFRSFATNHTYEIADTIRTLKRCEIKRSGPQFTFILEGDGFLYRMCRVLVGTLVQVGQGKFGTDEVRRMLEAKDRRAAGMSAPAHGLVLWKVHYRRARAGTGRAREEDSASKREKGVHAPGAR